MDISSMTDKQVIEKLMSLNGWNQTEVSRQLGFKSHVHVSYVMNDKGNLSGASRKLAGILLKESEKQE